MSAKEAFKAYIRAYDSHHLKQIFDINTVDLQKVAVSFGFKVPPRVDLNVGSVKSDRPMKRGGGGGFGYFKSMNAPRKQADKSLIFKQPKQRSAGVKRKFES